MTEKRHGKGLLFIVTLVLAAGVIKYADIPFAQTVREKAASALSGAANADHVLAVFGGSAMPADTVPAESSGGADDILDRDQTLFQMCIRDRSSHSATRWFTALQQC